MADCDVIIMSVSQSNGYGFPNLQSGFSWPASAPNPSAIGPVTDVYLWSISNSNFTLYNPNTEQIWTGTTHYFSWDLPLAISRKTARGVPQFVLKFAVGGTSYFNSAQWADAGANYRTQLQLYIGRAKEWLAVNGWNPTFTLLLIDHGETDSGAGNVPYFKEQQKMVSQIRYWTGNLKLQVIVRELTNASQIVTAQNLFVAADSRYYKFAPAGTANYATAEGTHFTGASLWTMGGLAETIAASKSYP